MLNHGDKPNGPSKTKTGVMLIWVMIVALIAGPWAHSFVTVVAGDEGRPPDALVSGGGGV